MGTFTSKYISTNSAFENDQVELTDTASHNDAFNIEGNELKLLQSQPNTARSRNIQLLNNIVQIWSSIRGDILYSVLSGVTNVTLIIDSLNFTKEFYVMAPAKEKNSWVEIEEEKFHTGGTNVFCKKKQLKGIGSHSICSIHDKDNSTLEKNSNDSMSAFSRGKSSLSLRSNSRQGNSSDTKSKHSSDTSSDCPGKTNQMESRKISSRISIGKSKLIHRILDNDDPCLNTMEEIKVLDVCHSIDENETTNEYSDYIDARWEALCLPGEKEQVLTPCPTCGRKFSEEAAYRHFPICSKVKEKCCIGKTAKPTSIVSSLIPSFISVMAAEPADTAEKRDETLLRKPNKPIVFTFTRGYQRCSSRSSERSYQVSSPSQSNNKPSTNSSNPPCIIQKPNNVYPCSAKNDFNEHKYRKKKVPILKSEGIRKSASIWKKSIKEFVRADPNLKPTNNLKKSNSSESLKSTISCQQPIKTPNKRESQDFISVDKTTLCPSCGRRISSNSDKTRSELRSKNKSKRYLNRNKHNAKAALSVIREVKEEANMHDVEAVPQSQRTKDNVDISIKKRSKLKCSIDELSNKMESCYFCRHFVPASSLDSHVTLCERIRNIELTISKVVSVEGSSSSTCSKRDIPEIVHKSEKSNTTSPISGDYYLFKHGHDNSASTQRTLTSLQCPCCAQLLDIRQNN